MDDDGGDLEARAGATFRNLLGWCLDGAATPPELDHLCPALEPASRSLAAAQPRAVHLYWNRPQTATGPPRLTQAV